MSSDHHRHQLLDLRSRCEEQKFEKIMIKSSYLLAFILIFDTLSSVFNIYLDGFMQFRQIVTET